ncbi:MAG TPA: SDR family oxidoreductase [Verrucomicrobiae bacterium]|nr:SDR family oxidoreductase [Verrucomicrobiae bacterium]
MKTETALITGAASGIGLALAKEFAKHGHNLVLTSRVRSELRDVVGELTSKYNIEVGTMAADLEDPTGPEQLFDAVQREAVPIDILVNNAGIGFRGRFWEIPIEDQLSMVRVNIEAVIRMTHLFLPQMIRRNRGRIMNTSSIGGFDPGPLVAVYHASKAFVLSFTEALATELEETDLTVTALCPGPTDTDFFPKAGMEETKAFQKAHVMAPQDVAEIAYQGLMRGDRTVVTGGTNKALVFARRFITVGAQAKINKKFYEKAKPSQIKRHRGDFERKAAREEAKKEQKQLAE